jgi:hypothetical protein
VGRVKKQGWVRAAAVLVFVGAAATASGQPAPQGTGSAPSAAPAPSVDPNIEEARKHYDLGVAAANARYWDNAVKEFTIAYRLKPTAQIAGNLGQAELEVGRFRDAAEHISRFIREYKDLSADDRKVPEGWLAKAKAKIATLLITVDPGAEVLIDDKSVGTAPLAPEVYVDAGKPHTIVARLGNARDEVTDTYAAGTTREVKLAPKPPPPSVPTFTVRPLPTASATSGGEQTGPRTGLVIGSVVAGGAAIAGVAFAVLSANARNQAEETRKAQKFEKADCLPPEKSSDCSKLRSLVQDQNTFGWLSAGSFIGMGVAVVGTLGYLYLTPKTSTTGTQPVRAGAIVNASGGKLVLEGSW